MICQKLYKKVYTFPITQSLKLQAKLRSNFKFYRELAEPNAAKAACGAIEPSTQSVELSQTTVCEIFALAKTDRPTGRFKLAQFAYRVLRARMNREPCSRAFDPKGRAFRQQPESDFPKSLSR